MEPELLGRRLTTPADEPYDEDSPGGDPAQASLRWLPDQPAASGLRGWVEGVRTDPGRAGVVALGAVAILAVLVTVFTVLRQPPPPASANLPPVQAVSSASSSATQSPPGSVVISVVGLVQRPGLVTLTDGARIADAVTAAGGTLDGADVLGLNMARRVVDGDQIVVGVAPVPGQPVGMASSIVGVGGAQPPARPGASAAPAGKVNLNTATEAELDALPGIGAVTAASIVRWRTEHRKFTSVDQLSEVDGIGPGRLDKLRDLVSL